MYEFESRQSHFYMDTDTLFDNILPVVLTVFMGAGAILVVGLLGGIVITSFYDNSCASTCVAENKIPKTYGPFANHCRCVSTEEAAKLELIK